MWRRGADWNALRAWGLHRGCPCRGLRGGGVAPGGLLRLPVCATRCVMQACVRRPPFVAARRQSLPTKMASATVKKPSTPTDEMGLVFCLHNIQRQLVLSTISLCMLQRPHRTNAMSMYDEMYVACREWQTGILESWIIRL